MLIIAGRITFDPTHTETAKAAAAEMMAATLQEEGCQDYVFSIDMADEATIRIFEIWDSEEHLAAHFQTEHMKVYRDKIAGIGVSGPQHRQVPGGVQRTSSDRRPDPSTRMDSRDRPRPSTRSLRRHGGTSGAFSVVGGATPMSVMVFIDGQNLVKALQRSFRARVHPVLLGRHLAGGREIVDIRYYSGIHQPRENPDIHALATRRHKLIRATGRDRHRADAAVPLGMGQSRTACRHRTEPMTGTATR